MSTRYAERIARSRWNQRRTALLQEGRWQPFVDAQPARDHVNVLRASGMSPTQISKRTGVGVGTLNHLLFGGHGCPPAERIRNESAAVLLAFKPTIDDYADNALVNSIGTIRRVQALAVMGWPGSELARRSATFSRNTLFRMRPDVRICAYVARAVRDLYDELADVAAEDAGVDLLAVKRARGRAARGGFAGAIAWDDDTIDDPAAGPDYGTSIPRYIALGEDCLELERQGLSRERIAERLGVTRDGLQRALSIYRQKTANPADMRKAA